MLVQVTAGVLLLLGSGLIFHVLLRPERTADSAQSPLTQSGLRPPTKTHKLPRAA